MAEVDRKLLPPPYNLDAQLDSFITCILGPSGIGKTRMAIASLPPEARVIILITEPGLTSVRDELRERKNTYKVFNIEKYNQLLNMATHLKSHVDKFDYIVLDSVNELQNMISNEIKDKFTGYKYWDELQFQLLRILYIFKHIPRIFIFTCLEERKDTEDRVVINPFLKGSMKDQLFPMCDEVYYLTPLPKEYSSETQSSFKSRIVAITNRDFGYPCKNRAGKLDYYENPDLTAIIRKILGYVPGLKE
jgi:hypothetical protein